MHYQEAECFENGIVLDTTRQFKYWGVDFFFVFVVIFLFNHKTDFLYNYLQLQSAGAGL